MKVISDKYFCRICGMYLDEKPWGDDDESPTYDICNCCGAEFGNEDYSIESIRRYRTEWIEKGTIWFSPNDKPQNWNLEEQLENIPKRFL